MKKIILKKLIFLSFLILFLCLLNLSVICPKAHSGTTGYTLGEQKTLVAMFNFPDTTDEPFTVSYIKQVIESDTDSVDNRIRDNSYGKTWLEVDYVLGWQTLPNPSSDYTTISKLRIDSISTLDPMVYFPDYSRFIFVYVDWDAYNLAGQAAGWSVFESPDDGIFYAGLVFMNENSFNAGHITHELGHTFGFSHHKSVVCTSPYGVPDNLLDPSYSCSKTYSSDMHDVMGMTGHKYFSSIWEVQAQWIEESQIHDAGFNLYNNTFIVEQIELPSNGKKVLIIPLGVDPYGVQYHYWLEYRENYQTVQIRTDPFAYFWRRREVTRFMRNDSEYNDIDLVTPFFHDPYRGVKIELLAFAEAGPSSKVWLKVARSRLSVTPESLLHFPETYINSTTSETVSISNNSDASIGIGNLLIQGRHSNLFDLSNDYCSNRTLVSDESCEVTISFSPDSDGVWIATLMMPNNDSLRPEATIALYGRGGGDYATETGSGGDLPECE